MLLTNRIILVFVFACFIIFGVVNESCSTTILTTNAYNFNVNTAPGTVTGVRTVYRGCTPSMGTCLVIPVINDLFTSFLGDLAVAFFVGYV